MSISDMHHLYYFAPILIPLKVPDSIVKFIEKISSCILPKSWAWQVVIKLSKRIELD
jgi:hypothetical protein